MTTLKEFLLKNEIPYNNIWVYISDKKKSNGDMQKIPIGEKNNKSLKDVIKINNENIYQIEKPIKTKINKKEYILSKTEYESLFICHTLYIKYVPNLYCIDIDDKEIKSLDDFNRITNIFKECPWVKGNTKGIHIYVYINNVPEYTNQQDVFKEFEGDFIKTNNMWENIEKEVNNYFSIPRIDYTNIKDIFKYNFFENKDDEKTIIEEYKEPINETSSEISDITYINNEIYKTKNKIELADLKKYLNGLSKERSNNYSYWTKVLWGIPNIGYANKWSLKIKYELMHEFSKKSEKYDEIEVDNFIENNIKDDKYGIGVGTIIEWYREDNKDENNNEMIKTILNNRIRDYDIAKYIKTKIGDIFVCINIESNIWYKFENHKWVQDDGGYTLLKIISDIIPLDVEIILNKLKKIITDDNENSEIKLIKKNINDCELFIDKCRNNAGKKNILKELKILYKKENFIDNLDINPYLLCCKNGIIDFEKNEFRDGRPEDMCSLSTGYNYISLKEIKDNDELLEYYKEVEDFFDKLFVFAELKNYMYEHLASALIGICKEQDFNYYIGKGSNGKSMLVNLIMLMLGQYSTTLPTSLLCSKKVDIGSCSSEIALLRGVRYALMQEPTKGEHINEGAMKGLTGSDPIFCNPKFKTPFYFTPMFHLVICANFTLDIKSNDDGTWRRIKVVEFLSKFKKIMDKEEENTELFEFEKDINLTNNFPNWKSILLAILTEKAYELKGKINECKYVANATKKYREEQDRIGKYIKDNLEITKKNDNKVDIKILGQNFKDWYELNYKYKIGIKFLMDRLEDEYDIKMNNINISGIILNENDNDKNMSDEDIFIKEFLKDFEIKKDEKDKYFIKSIRISEWSKMKGLNIYTSKMVNKILLEHFGLDSKDGNIYKYKKINGISTLCWYGLKEKIYK